MNRTPQKDWTVMIYMAADNDLDTMNARTSEAIKDLKMIKRIGSTERVSILAQLDRAESKKTLRFYLKKGGDYLEDVEMTLGETNTGDPCEMVDFLDWGMSGEHQARNYLVILWGHGAGALDVDFITGNDPPQSRLKQCRLRRQESRYGKDEVRKLIEKEEMKNISTDDLFPHHKGLFDRLVFAPSRFSMIARDRAKLFGIDLDADGSLDYL